MQFCMSQRHGSASMRQVAHAQNTRTGYPHPAARKKSDLQGPKAIHGDRPLQHLRYLLGSQRLRRPYPAGRSRRQAGALGKLQHAAATRGLLPLTSRAGSTHVVRQRMVGSARSNRLADSARGSRRRSQLSFSELTSTLIFIQFEFEFCTWMGTAHVFVALLPHLNA